MSQKAKCLDKERKIERKRDRVRKNERDMYIHIYMESMT